jgi:BA14K-like protein
MKNLLLCGIAIASILMIQPIPASAQRVHGAGHPHIGRGYAGHGPARFQYQRGGYAHGYGPGYGIGAGAAALATGALIGGAIATQDQGYYPVQTYPAYSDTGYVYSDAAPTVYNNGGSVAYCEQTYRSYDPVSGSYLGYDGFRHPCP